MHMFESSQVFTQWNVFDCKENCKICHLEKIFCDTSYEVCKWRDAILRPFLIGINWNKGLEFDVVRGLLMRPYPDYWVPFAERYPLLFDYEWQLPDTMYKGDLLFTDGVNHFLVAEIKSLQTAITQASTKRKTWRTNLRKRKKKAGEQANRLAVVWHQRNPQVISTKAVVVAETKLTQVAHLVREGPYTPSD